jgi:hypothetical protein
MPRFHPLAEAARQTRIAGMTDQQFDPTYQVEPAMQFQSIQIREIQNLEEHAARESEQAKWNAGLPKRGCLVKPQSRDHNLPWAPIRGGHHRGKKSEEKVQEQIERKKN